MTNYKHLTKEDRFTISLLFFKENKSLNYIAKFLNKNRSTISRELKRNTFYGNYYYKKANRKYIRRKSNCHMFCMLKYKTFTELFLSKFNKRSHGIESTIHWIKMNYPCVKIPSVRQVYRWINKKIWVIQRKDCLRGKYKRGRKRIYGMMSKLKSKYFLPISIRSKKINERKEFGHWEADLIIGRKEARSHHLLTLVERTTRYAIIKKIKNKSPKTMIATLYNLIRDEKLIVKSITVDNGFEFEMMGITAKQFKFKAYYCQPYSSFQRGSNENLNGIVRRWFKKGFDFTFLDDKKVLNLQWKINHMPRKMFGFKSSFDIYSQYNL